MVHLHRCIFLLHVLTFPLDKNSIQSLCIWNIMLLCVVSNQCRRWKIESIWCEPSIPFPLLHLYMVSSSKLLCLILNHQEKSFDACTSDKFWREKYERRITSLVYFYVQKSTKLPILYIRVFSSRCELVIHWSPFCTKFDFFFLNWIWRMIIMCEPVGAGMMKDP